MSILVNGISNIWSSVSSLVMPTYDKAYFLQIVGKNNDFTAKCKLVDKFKERESELLSWLSEIGFNKSNQRNLRLNALDLFRFIPYEAFNKLTSERNEALLEGLLGCLDEEDIYICNYAMGAISRNIQVFKRFSILEEKMTKLLYDKDSAIASQAAVVLGKISNEESFKALFGKFVINGVAFDLETCTRDDILLNDELCDVLDDFINKPNLTRSKPIALLTKERRYKALATSFNLARKGQ